MPEIPCCSGRMNGSVEAPHEMVGPGETDAWRSPVVGLHFSLTKWKFEPQRDIAPLNYLKQKA